MHVLTMLDALAAIAVIAVCALIIHWHFWSIKFAERCLKAYERRTSDGGDWPVERKL